MTIKISKYSNLPTKTKRQLESFIHEEFGHIPIVQETEWATPNWVIIYYDQNEIVTFNNIVERNILIDDIKYKAGGLNNVITPKSHRGNGYATKLIKQAEKMIFDNLKCDLGLLLCADALIPFYQRFDWYKVNCSVNFSQSDGIKTWGSNTMLLTPNKNILPTQINLNGLPW